MRVDGPYGSAGNLTKYEELVLIGGGIAATPIHSVLSFLLGQQQNSGMVLKRVRVILVARTIPELGIFADTLYAAHAVADGSGLAFSVELFATKQAGPEPQDHVLLTASSLPWVSAASTACTLHAVCFLVCYVCDPIFIWCIGLRQHAQSGRPDLAALLRGIGEKDIIFVCGPQPLCDCASEIAFDRGAAFHTEVFYF